MAYAKQASRRRSPARMAVPRSLWFMVTAVIALFVSLLLWLGTREPQPAMVSQSVPTKEPDKEPAAPAPDARASTKPKEVVPPAPPPPRYEFYNMLPAQKVEVPSPPAATTVPPSNIPPPGVAGGQPLSATMENPPIPPQAATGVRYELQVGSFRRYEEADRRKAELAMLGFTTTIQSANVNGEIWHRVKIGPMPEAEARRVRERLKAVGMNPLLVKQGG